MRTKPVHPDMDLFEKVLQGQDARAEGKVPMAEMVPGLDPSSVMWAASQRSMRADNLNSTHGRDAVLAALWLDGLAAGLEMARRKALGTQERDGA